MDSQSARYDPMNRAHILDFPNRIPCIDWKTSFPKFKDEEGDDASLHLIKFHMHSHKLNVEWYEDCLMKMFMATLEGNARSWYESLLASSLYSLEYFHLTFYENYKESHSCLSLFENCCQVNFENFIQHMENDYGDEELMDEEIKEFLEDYI